jgi:hypothetical protein
MRRIKANGRSLSGLWVALEVDPVSWTPEGQS